MTQKIARYVVMNGLRGCYMPDHIEHAAFATRKELAEYIRDKIEWLDMPKKLFRDVQIRRIWRYIQRNGSSTAHFALWRNGYGIEFNGLTQAEYNEYERQADNY